MYQFIFVVRFRVETEQSLIKIGHVRLASAIFAKNVKVVQKWSNAKIFDSLLKHGQEMVSKHKNTDGLFLNDEDARLAAQRGTKLRNRAPDKNLK